MLRTRYLIVHSFPLMRLLQNDHGNAIGQNLLAISTTLSPVALIDPGVNLPLNKRNEDKVEHKTTIYECFHNMEEASY
jgi:hypothetical protein